MNFGANASNETDRIETRTNVLKVDSKVNIIQLGFGGPAGRAYIPNEGMPKRPVPLSAS